MVKLLWDWYLQSLFFLKFQMNNKVTSSFVQTDNIILEFSNGESGKCLLYCYLCNFFVVKEVQ